MHSVVCTSNAFMAPSFCTANYINIFQKQNHHYTCRRSYMTPQSVFMPELWRLTLEDLQTWRACVEIQALM